MGGYDSVKVRPMIVKEVLPNGLTLLSEAMPHVRSVAIGVWLKQGSRHESDALSGIATCPAPLVLGEAANQTASGTAVDEAGNTASAAVAGINIDQTAPAIALGGLKEVFTLGEAINLTCAATDGLSGVAPSGCTLAVSGGTANFTAERARRIASGWEIFACSGTSVRVCRLEFTRRTRPSVPRRTVTTASSTG